MLRLTVSALIVLPACTCVLEAQSPGRVKTTAVPSQQEQDQQKVSRLKTLVEAAETALAEGNEDLAAERVEEAEVFIADWSLDLLSREDVDGLLERIAALGKVLGDFFDESGIKSAEEEAGLRDDELQSEMELIAAAESGAVFDVPIDLNDKVLTYVNAFTGRRKETIQNCLTRGSRYMPMIRRILAEEGVPGDLSFLPIVESGFRNEARSRAAAVGMWQFIRATGRTYGLQQDSWVDERRDPAKATRAAAKFLRHLFETNDDWYLALAGYNAGQGRVNGAINGTDSRNFWDHARSKYLRTETKNYVPQFCAAVLVGKHPRRFGLEVAQLEPYEYEYVVINKSISLGELERRAGLGPDELRELNPELIRRTTPPRSYELKVPIGAKEAVAEAVAAIPAAERLEFRTYKIKKGDTLSSVSARYNITTLDLLDINNMTGSQFRVGRNIQVPMAVRVGATPNKPTQTPAKPPAKQAPNPAPKPAAKK